MRPLAKKAKVIGNRAYKNTEDRLRRFLENYGKTGRILRSCEAAGIDFTVHYRRLQNDPVYRAAFEEAEQAAAQHLEDKVYEMADGGDLQAALALLRRFRPHHYRERASVDVTADVSLADRLIEARARIITLAPPNDRNGTEG